MNFDFLKSSNFWRNVVLAIGGLFVGFKTQLGEDLVMQVFALISTTGLLREYFTNKPQIDGEKAVRDSNWWTYIAGIVTAFVPDLPLEAFDALQQVLVNLLGGNWQAGLVGAFSLINIIWRFIQDRNNTSLVGLNGAAVLSILFLLPMLLSAQAIEMPAPREVDRDYRKEYRRAIREYNDQENNSNAPIKIPIEESVPIEVSLSVTDFTNWTKPTVSPGKTAQRIVGAANYRVRYDVFDTGVESSHPDLKTILTAANNYTSESSAEDGHGHGTHVLGITLGYRGGVVYELAEAGFVDAYADKVLGSDGSGNFTIYANGLNDVFLDQAEFVEAGGYCVANSSLGYSGPPVSAVETALQKAYYNGSITHVAAAGNNGAALGYPGNSNYTISVGALDEDLSRASYSNYGEGLHVVAPGSRVNSTWIGGRYAKISGTSMASPASAAFFIAAYAVWGPKLAQPGRPLAYARWIARKLKPSDWDSEYGYGLTMLDKIVDYDPDDMEEQPDNPNPEPPQPQQEYNLTWDTGNYTMRWRPSDSRTYELLTIPAARVNCTTRANTLEAAWDACSGSVTSFFKNRAIVGVPDANEATWWTGRFLKIITDRTEVKILPDELTGQDQERRQFVRSGFDQNRPNGLVYLEDVNPVP